MDSKKSRIAAFIETLPSIEISEGAQSTMLKASMDYMGGTSHNGGDCTNITHAQCYKSTNGGDCKNTKFYCDNAKNDGNCGVAPVESPLEPPISIEHP